MTQLDPTVRTVAMINSDGKVEPPLPVPEATRIELRELRVRLLARTPYEHLITELSTVDAGEAALGAGADVVYIDSFGDYGIERLRAVSPVPVVGAGEASLGAVADRGRPASIVTVWPASMAYLYDERLASCRGGDLVRGVHHFSPESELDLVGTGASVKARMNRGESDLLDRLAQACQEAARLDGTDTILMGCTCMWSVAEQLGGRTGLHVLEPSRIGLQAAFDALDEPPARPAFVSDRRGTVTSVLDAWVDGDVGGSVVPTDDCEVCVFTPAV